MAEPRPVRLGVVGCGAVMLTYMAEAERLARRGHARVVAAADVDPAKRAVAERLGIPRFATDPRAVLEAPDVDVVLVLTPMRFHADLACAALAAGKHVLCEKTMAPTLAEADRMRAAARAAGRHLVCAPHVVLSPTYRQLWTRVRRGEIGRVVSARARYGWAAPFWETGWVYGADAGALFEFAVYNVTSLTGLLGPARRVAALTHVAVPERTVGGRTVKVEAEDDGHLLLDFGGGVLAAVTTSFVFQRYRSPAIELYGSEGTLQLLGDDWEPRGLQQYRNAEGCWTDHEETAPTWSWADGLRHLVSCVRHDRTPVVTADHAYHVLEILTAARAAAADGVARKLTSTFAVPDYAGAEPPEEPSP
jgi:predicted dehydrogenase